MPKAKQVKEVVDVTPYLNKDNWFNYAEFYDWVVAENSFSKFVEVGSWKGHSISHLAKKLVEKGKYFELFAVDLWDRLPKDNPLWETHSEQIPLLYDIYTKNLLRAGMRGHVFDLIGDSADMAKHFEDGSVDFVFIDASHSKEAVMRDIKAWKPKIRSGGILAGHDIHSDGVKAAVEACLEQAHYRDSSDVWHLRIK